jgi:hypothetical protein
VRTGVDVTGLGPCPVVGFGVGDVGLSGSIYRQFI